MIPRPLRRIAAVVSLIVVATAMESAPALAGKLDGEPGSGPQAPTVRVLAPSVRWYDVSGTHWAKPAIDYVAEAHQWMSDYPDRDGKPVFKPRKHETRKYFARAIYRAFAKGEEIKPAITFDDLSSKNPFYRFANVAVKLGWMTRRQSKFRPDEPVTTTMVHRALVLALGLQKEVAGLNRLHTKDGTRLRPPQRFAYLNLGMQLRLRYNHGTEAQDVGPATPLPRAEVAWSLYRAATTPDWTLASLAPYASIELPNLRPAVIKIVRFGTRYAGFPYVWGGEWYRPTPAGYCCGSQPVGGFDCSGLAWWAVKVAAGGWDNTPPRKYRGWSLPQRTSRDMASTGTRTGWKRKRPGDLLFYDGNGDGIVDHVDVFIGRGWALDSSSGYGGVSILRVGSGWYRDHFVRARRVV